MSYRTASRLAWSLWGLSLTQTALALVVLLALNASHPHTHIFDWCVGNTLSVIDVTVGTIVVSRRPENPIGWLLLVSALAITINNFSAQYVIYALLAQPGSLPAGEGWPGSLRGSCLSTVAFRFSTSCCFPLGDCRVGAGDGWRG
jgi:hypothetical protein